MRERWLREVARWFAVSAGALLISHCESSAPDASGSRAAQAGRRSTSSAPTTRAGGDRDDETADAGRVSDRTPGDTEEDAGKDASDTHAAAAGGGGAFAAADAGNAARGACTSAHPTGGCEDPATQQCVCHNGDRGCCDRAWDAICVSLVQSLRCKGDCCKATGSLGCADAKVESCVCALRPDCCDNAWNDFCTIVAEGACDACGK